ncbi:MAG: GspE/PulE/PilB domain-containing protein [Planctomycetota bacterium]|jgi:type IV pilus assembly protein PilB
MKHLEKLSRKRLGEVLVDEGLISKSQLSDAEEEQKRTGVPLGSVLVTANYVTEFDLAKTVCGQYQLPYLELGSFNPTKSVIELFPPEDLRGGRFFPIDELGTVITMAVPEVPDLEFLKEIRSRTGLLPFLFVSLLSDIEAAYDRILGKGGEEQPAKKPAAEKPPEAEEPADQPIDVALDQALPDEGEYAIDVAVEGEDDGELPSIEPGDDWANLFDSANESVLKEIDRE